MEPLYTTDTTGERSGMGFSFMEAFMDEVTVESEPGKGTAVTMKTYWKVSFMDETLKLIELAHQEIKQPGTGW